MEYVNGDFKFTMTQEAADFYGKHFEEMGQLAGSHWKCNSKVMDDAGKKLFWRLECEEFPALNMMHISIEGKEQEMQCLGVKCKFVYRMTKPGHIEAEFEYEKYGCFVVSETFSADGIARETTIKATGVSYKDTIERVVDIDGTYRLIKSKNLDDFTMIFDGFGPEFLTNPEYKFTMVENPSDGSVTTVDYVMGQEYLSVLKLDVEMVQIYDKNVSALMVKVGPGHYKTVFKHNDGRIQEWIMRYSADDTITFDAKDLKNGKTCCMTFEKYADFSGEYKIISSCGLENLMELFGVSKEQGKFVKDPSLRRVIKESGCMLTYTVSVNGAVIDDHCLNLGEESKRKLKSLGGIEVTGVSVKHGNEITSVFKGSDKSMKCGVKLTKNFMVETIEIIGTGITYTAIWMRVN